MRVRVHHGRAGIGVVALDVDRWRLLLMRGVVELSVCACRIKRERKTIVALLLLLRGRSHCQVSDLRSQVACLEPEGGRVATVSTSPHRIRNACQFQLDVHGMPVTRASCGQSASVCSCFCRRPVSGLESRVLKSRRSRTYGLPQHLVYDLFAHTHRRANVR